MPDPLIRHAHQVIAESLREERKATRRRGADPRIVDPATHPKKFVSLVVAADFLEVDRKTLAYYLDERKIAYQEFGKRRKIAVVELVAFLQRGRVARPV